MSTGEGFATTDQYLPMRRTGELEETYWTYSFTPIAGEDGRVVGVFNIGQETTSRVLLERRNKLRLALSDSLRTLDKPGEILTVALDILSEYINVSRLIYGEMNAETKSFRIEACWSKDGVPLLETFLSTGWGDTLRHALFAGDLVVIDDVEADDRLAGTQAIERFRKLGVCAVVIAPVIRNGRFTGALTAHQDRPHKWRASEIELLQTATSRLWQELTRTKAEMAMNESERRLRLVFEQARDFIFTADLDQTISTCNPAAAKAIGLPADQIIGHSIGEFLALGEFERTTSMLHRKLAEGGTTRYEVSVMTAKGETRQWDINSALTIDVDGAPIGLHAVARDVTEKRAFDERQQLLINELNHRVKNTLALVQGLALQSFKRDRSIVEGQQTFQARLATLAAAHDLLTRQLWEGATVSAVVADAIAPYADPANRIKTFGPHILLEPKAAISLVLALHELGTNAAKYGALSVPEGKVSIVWNIEADRDFTLVWREESGPPVKQPTHRGFGLKMLERALASDLAGSVNISFIPEGLTCTITAKLPELA